MHIRWFGIGLLLVSLLVASLAWANVKVPYGREEWAKTEKDDALVDATDQVVLVPPWNGSEGWVGFSVTLPNEGKPGYSAHGTLAPADQDPNPNIVMRAVNETGLDYLMFDQFSSAAWNVTEVYAAPFLTSTYRSSSFEFDGLDNCSHYILLFRGLKDEAKDRPILVSIKEKWFEPRTLLELTPWNTSIIAAVSFIGLGLIIYDLNSRRKKERLKHTRSIRKYDKDRKRSAG
jgi:hypothetical protein